MTQDEVVASVIAVLEAIELPYMVTGSLASSYHGVPRTTHDADPVVAADRARVLELVERLGQGFYVSADAARDALDHETLFNAVHLDSGLEIDLIPRKSREYSRVELERRQPGRLAGRDVMFATPEDTILSKLEWAQTGGSERQLDDVRNVVWVQGDRLDWGYLDRWAGDLGVAELLAQVREHDRGGE